MGAVVEISFLTESDRACWEVLARGIDTYFEVERSDDAYERTWRRLLDDERMRGIEARLDGKMVGIAHYLFHASIWYAGKCYLADLFLQVGLMSSTWLSSGARQLWWTLTGLANLGRDGEVAGFRPAREHSRRALLSP
jgi:hypothetical protein